MIRFFKQIAPWWLLVVGVLVATGVVWQATRLTYDVALESIEETGEERLTLYGGTLREALSRYAYLPYVLARNGAVQELLASDASSEQVNLYLEGLNREAGSDALYVMDATGNTVAASNWRQPFSYIGQNYGYRPYFIDAKAGHEGRFFAIGATTGRPGFFMSYPVHRSGRFLGVVVAKVDLDPLQDDWHQGGEIVMVSDANGVLFLSSRKDWKYTTLTPLSAEQRAHISAGRQYSDQTLKLFPLQTVKTIDQNRSIVRDGKIRYLLLSRQLVGQGWKLFHVAPLAPVRERAEAVALIGTASALLILALGMYARERRQKQLSRHKAHEAEAIKAVNLRLQEEVEEHCRTEHALRNTQAELVQNSKLAALGQMAAGIVHELNQPIAAIRTHSASGRLLLDRHEEEKARESFSSVTRITDHMASITAQLKTFAYKTPRHCEPVLVQDCLTAALGMTETLLAEVGVVVEIQQPTEPVMINGDRNRLEQVLVNLIRNGVDAMRETEQRLLNLSVSIDRELVEIVLCDSGTGIGEENLAELFNPFFTTKEVGKGLGLGLSISYRIIADLGGTIRATNNSGAGASFVVRLPTLPTLHILTAGAIGVTEVTETTGVKQ